MDCSTPGFPVNHQFPELAQIHVHRVGDAIQPSYPLSSPSPPLYSLTTISGPSEVGPVKGKVLQKSITVILIDAL